MNGCEHQAVITRLLLAVGSEPRLADISEVCQVFCKRQVLSAVAHPKLCLSREGDVDQVAGLSTEKQGAIAGCESFGCDAGHYLNLHSTSQNQRMSRPSTILGNAF